MSHLSSHRSIRALILSLTLVSCLGIRTPKVSANEISLVVSPPSFDLELSPGESVQKSVKITNNSQSNSVSLQVFASDFIVQDDLGTPLKVTLNQAGRYLASPWMTLSANQITLAPKSTEQVVVTIDTPSTALPGGHYAGVFFENTQDTKTGSTASYTSTQLGSLFSINIKGDVNYDAIIHSFIAPALSEFGPINFKLVVENLSDTHIRPQIKVVIKNMLGLKQGELIMDELNIFPFTTRTLEESWQQVWGLGRYSAEVFVSYGPGLTTTRLLYFWILPYRLLIAVLVTIMTLIAIILSIKAHLRHKRSIDSQEIDMLKRKIIEMENRER